MGRGTPSDVPLHRGSVGAMQVAGCNRMPPTERPYTYRGTGVDIHEAPRVVKPKPKPKPKRKRKPKPKPFRYTTPPDTRRLDISDESTWANWKFPETPAPEPPKPPVHRPSIRPSPGWQPMKGADLDDLLNELEDDD